MSSRATREPWRGLFSFPNQVDRGSAGRTATVSPITRHIDANHMLGSMNRRAFTATTATVATTRAMTSTRAYEK